MPRVDGVRFSRLASGSARSPYARYANKEIAKALLIAEVTVKMNVRQILRKLGVRSRTRKRR